MRTPMPSVRDRASEAAESTGPLRTMMPSVRDRGGMPSVRDRGGEVQSEGAEGGGEPGELKSLAATKQLSKKKASEYVDGRGETATEKVFPITVVNDVQEGPKRRCFATIKSTDKWKQVKKMVASKLDISWTDFKIVTVKDIGQYEDVDYESCVLKAGQDLQELLDNGVGAKLTTSGISKYLSKPKPPPPKRKSVTKPAAFRWPQEANRLVAMGFEKQDCEKALTKHNGNEGNALNELLTGMTAPAPRKSALRPNVRFNASKQADTINPSFAPRPVVVMPPPPRPVAGGQFRWQKEADRLSAMGFAKADCADALIKHNGNEANALNELLSSM